MAGHTLKLYRVEGRSAFILPQLNEALGLPRHIQQVDMLVVAGSKAAAGRLLASTRYVSVSPSAVRVAEGNDATAFAAAGQLTEPGVYVHHHNGRRSEAGGREVLRVDLDGSTRVAGHFTGWTYTDIRFIRAEESTCE